jgi:dephospho-CoA kinase
MTPSTHTGFRAGITGGIGSGKSTVCRLFEALGVPVYDADYWAKWLLNHDYDLKKAVVALFGPDAYTADGAYNRAYIGQIVFQDKAKLAALNALAHPAVEKHSQAWHDAQIAQGARYTLKEAALMIESGNHLKLDFLILVYAPENVRIQRVMTRDGATEAQVRARMQNQMPEDAKRALADAVIDNDGSKSLIQQVWKLHQKMLERAKK